MNKEIISCRQGIVLVILFIWGSALVIGTGGAAGRGAWLAKVIGVLIALPVLLIYIKLLCMFEGNDIFDISRLIFGKFIGRIIILLFIWFALHIGALTLYSFSEFVSTVGLDKTPKIIFIGTLMFLCTWGVKEGIENLGRWAELMIVFLVFILFIMALLSIPNLKFSNLLPVLEKGIKPLIKGSFSAFSYPFTETVIFAMVLTCLNDKKSIFKTYIFGTLIGGFTLVIIAAINVAVLGEYIMFISYFPTYSVVGRIDIGHFLQRLESVVSILFLISGFIQISISLLGAARGISKFFNFKDYRFVVTPVALIILNLGFLVSDDMMELKNWNIAVYPYYGSIFEVILPLLVLIVAKIRYKKIKGKYSNMNNG